MVLGELMEIITLDFETYYSKEYSLSKLTTEEYVRDPRFEVIMLGIRWPDGRTEVVDGTHLDIKHWCERVEWGRYAVLCHNTLFDAAILSWRFGVNPAAWLDTLSMGRAMFGARNNSLASLAKRYNLDDKGTFVKNVMGMRRVDFSPSEFQQYAEYCLLDVELCFQLWELMSNGWYNPQEVDNRGPYPIEELKLIDLHIRMFTEPMLRLNSDKLKAHLDEVLAHKAALMEKVTVDKSDLMSNQKFAVLLENLGVQAPMKISPTTGKETFAFAKTDPGMKALLDHEDPTVQALAAARLGVKSTLEETRTQRFIDIASRDPRFPVPLKYAYARTKRSSGGDGINLQNLPSRGNTGLKSCIEAPGGWVLIDCDSSNIEARVLAWWAQQDDLTADFAAGVDVYCKLATKIYGRTITKADERERFVGKTATLGCGYSTGAMKLKLTLKAAKPPVELEDHDAERIINTYRSSVPHIVNLWADGEKAIRAMYHDEAMWMGREGVVLVEGRKGIKLPSGLYISYPQLHRVMGEKFSRWAYKDDTGIVDIYGGKLVENICQALARIIVMSQMLRISRKLPVKLTVHDSVIALAREEEAKEARAYVEECMRWVPKWAQGCPINCESEWGYSYGDTRK
jgi:DNA polymerase I-like protein with 3'-5' exonuclease and polymerase domains